MNGKQVQALALTLLVASSCMAVPAWMTSAGESCKNAWTSTSTFCKEKYNAHPRIIGGVAATAVVATAGGAVAWRKHVLAKRAQKAEAQRLESRSWFAKKLDAIRGR